MKRLTLLLLPILSLSLMMACNLSGGQESQANIDDAVASTVAAQAAAQSEIDAAVQATTAALPTLMPVATTEPVVVTNTVVVTVTNELPTESAADYTTMSEEELLVYIDQTVNQAVAATSASATASSSATSDGDVSSSEVETIEVYVSGAEEAVELAEEMIDYYYAVYGATATAAVDELAAVEAELAAISSSIVALNDTLVEIEATLDAGLALAEETIAQLETAAATAATSAETAMANLQIQLDEIAAMTGAMQANAAETIAAASEQFATTLANIQPNEIASNPTDAIAQVQGYLGLVQGAMADNAISPDEFAAIAQAGANAQASLNGLSGGNADFSGLSQSINQLTGQLASGNLESALSMFNGIAASLPAVPAGSPGGRRP
ncbi:MAG: hypothetical protein KDE59_25450 [Anaerolineales bacterium]|nr:hypothetical protein [Anaerolineales bacterium]